MTTTNTQYGTEQPDLQALNAEPRPGWRFVEPGEVLPPGMQFEMDMQTGRSQVWIEEPSGDKATDTPRQEKRTAKPAEPTAKGAPTPEPKAVRPTRKAAAPPGRLHLSRSNPYSTSEQFLQSAGCGELIHYRGDFYTWADSCYRKLDDGEIRAQLYAFLDAAVVSVTVIDKDGNHNTTQEHFKPDDRAVNKVIDALKARARVSSELEAPAWLSDASPEQLAHKAADILPCVNGLLDLRTGTLLPHSPDFLTMNAVDYAFDPEATAPRWAQFLEEVLPGDREAQETLEEILGYMLTADTSQQKIFALIGAKRSGKGTIARIGKVLLGGSANVANPTVDSLKTNFGLQPLINKRAAIIGDARLDEKVRVLVERLLSISGEDGITIDRKGREHWTGQLGVRFMILSNNPPEFADDSGAMTDRIILVRFRQSFLNREDTTLTDKLLAELPGILNRALVGLRRLQERGHFVQPASAAEMLQMMADIAAPLRKFIRECCEVNPQYSIGRDDLHDAYVAWCTDNGHEHPMSKTRFPLVLTTACPEVDTRRMGPRGAQFTRCLGIRLVPPTRRKARHGKPGPANASASADEPAAVLPLRKLPRDPFDTEQAIRLT